MLHINPSNSSISKLKSSVTSSKFAQQKLDKLKQCTTKLTTKITNEAPKDVFSKTCCNKFSEQKHTKIK